MTLEGQFQIYTGDGKGKTTAALGLAVRAAGAGMRVYIGQFIKDQEYHEVPLLRRLGVVVELYGTGKGCLIGKHPAQEDLDAAADGLKKAQAALQSGRYDLVILDEINVAWQLGLLQETQLEQLAKLRPQPVELFIPDAAARPHCFNWRIWSPKCRRSSITTTPKGCWRGKGLSTEMLLG